MIIHFEQRETITMINLILGLKGSGKTKYLIDNIDEAVKTSEGCVVAIERGATLRFDVNHDVRLIDIDEYDITDFNSFYGFLSGLIAGNYDISHIFVDATFKIIISLGNNIEVDPRCHVIFRASPQQHV